MSNGQKKFHLKGQGEWLTEIRGSRSIKQMAELLGISERAYRHYENEERKISGPVKKLIEIDQCSQIGEPKNDYDLHGAWKPMSIEELTGIPKGKGMGKAIEMLVDIYNSKNEEIIISIYKVLQAFSNSINPAASKKTNNDE